MQPFRGADARTRDASARLADFHDIELVMRVSTEASDDR